MTMCQLRRALMGLLGIPGLALGIGLALPSAALAAPPTVEDIRRAHAELAKGLGFVKLDEIVIHTVDDSPAARARIDAMFGQPPEKPAGAAASAGGNDDAKMAEAVKRQLEQSRSTMKLQRAVNSGVPVRRTRTLDLLGGRVRWDDQDLRDVVAVAQTLQLDHLARVNIDKNLIVICANGGRLHANPIFRTGSKLQGDSVDDVRDDWRRLGLLSEENFVGSAEPTLEWDEASQVATLTRIQGTLTIRSTLRQADGWRIASWEMIVENGSRLKFVARDYRNWAGRLVPQVTRFESIRSPSETPEVTECSTLAVEFPESLAADAFTLPSDFRLTEFPARPAAGQ
ncbi:MAG: hypothetical protein SF069_19210 [Phycisphaerae bacterium]|nr:hypothetical protein [Phycisphaerae bacterium]